MTQTLEANQLQDARVRFTVTAGDGSNVPADSTSGQTFVVHAVPNQKYAIRERIMKVDWPRNERSALKGAKCASYAENIIALNHAHRHGFGEAIFANTHGDICEGATTNVFFIQGEEVLTPSTASGCLPGITREIVLDICRLNGIPFRESKIPVTFLEEAGECFLTSSTRGIQPVGQINERHLPEKPVSLTQRISTFYHKLFKENDNP